jgi:hypothetical protein
MVAIGPVKPEFRSEEKRLRLVGDFPDGKGRLCHGRTLCAGRNTLPHSVILPKTRARAIYHLVSTR